jgi:hypothetical protein
VVASAVSLCTAAISVQPLLALSFLAFVGRFFSMDEAGLLEAPQFQTTKPLTRFSTSLHEAPAALKATALKLRAPFINNHNLPL